MYHIYSDFHQLNAISELGMTLFTYLQLEKLFRLFRIQNTQKYVHSCLLTQSPLAKTNQYHSPG